MKKLFCLILILIPQISSAITLDGNGRWPNSLPCVSDTDVCVSPTGVCGISGFNANNVGCNTASGCSPAYTTNILSSANYSGGVGGRGIQFWFSNQTAEQSDGFKLGSITGSGNRHLWYRYYGKYPPSYTSSLLKQFWALDAGGSVGLLSIHMHLAGDHTDLNVGGGGTLNYGGIGMQAIIGGSTWDDQWHCFEWYIYRGNGDGIFRFWVDGIPLVNATNVVTDTQGTYGYSHAGLWINHSQSTPGTQCDSIEFDDIIITTNPSDPDLVTDINGNLMIGPVGYGSGDPTVTVVATDPVATEQGETSGYFTLTRSSTSGALAVDYTITGTATDTSDYGTLSGTANFTDGNATTTVMVAAVDDAAIEGDETVILTIDDGASYDLGNPYYATIIITDNDQVPPPPVQLGYADFESGTSGLANSGWYDNTSGQDIVYDAARDAADGADSGMVARYVFQAGNNLPDSGGAMRLQFSETPELYVDYYIKYSTNWVGNGVGTYGHHIINTLTNADNAWAGPHGGYLTGYFEGMDYSTVWFSFQDSHNIDIDNDGLNDDQINVDLTGNFSQGAAHGCHGNFTNAGTGVSCYDAGGGDHYNVRWWTAVGLTLADGNWHHVRYYVKMNTLTGSTINEDGILKVWVDDLTEGNQVINYSNVVIKKGWFASQFWNQVLVAPYLSGGNPLASSQTMYLDNVLVGTAVGDVVPPTNSGHSPAKDATDVAVDTDITQVCSDTGDGVVKANIVMAIEGADHCCSGETCAGGTADLSCTGSTSSWTITKSGNSFSNSQEVNIATDCTDGTNAMVTDVWKFTTVAATPAPSGTAVGGGSDSATGGGTGTIVGPTP